MFWYLQFYSIESVFKKNVCIIYLSLVVCIFELNVQCVRYLISRCRKPRIYCLKCNYFYILHSQFSFYMKFNKPYQSQMGRNAFWFDLFKRHRYLILASYIRSSPLLEDSLWGTRVVVRAGSRTLDYESTLRRKSY